MTAAATRRYPPPPATWPPSRASRPGRACSPGNAFLVTGMLPLAQSVAWLAVGVALGAAFRRTLPAIFTALIGYGAAYLLVERAYPSFMAPVTALAPLGGAQRLPSAPQPGRR